MDILLASHKGVVHTVRTIRGPQMGARGNGRARNKPGEKALSRLRHLEAHVGREPEITYLPIVHSVTWRRVDVVDAHTGLIL